MKMNEQLGLKRGSVLLSLALSLAVPVACGSDGGGGGNMGGTAANAGSPASAGGGVGGGAAGSNSAGSATGGAAGSATAGSSGASGSGGAGGSSSSGGCVVSKTDDEQPMLLSQTGCIDMADPTKPAKGLIPYSVRSPLWSDGATKERFLRLPDGGKVHVLDCATEVDKCKAPGLGGVGSDDGHWDMPVGTVLVKNFSIENKHVETRLLMRRSMTIWKGFSYEWNDAGTDATLLPDEGMGKDKPVGTGTQVWHYPSRAQCLECHTLYTGRSLGLTTAQLNSDFPYAEGAMNQVEKFKQLGLFDAPPKDIAGYPTPESTDGTPETRALSYLQTNCSICHRPGSEGGLIDFRFGTAFADRGLCEKSEQDTGKVPAYRLVPGSTDKSSVSFRIHALDTEVRMPKIGSNVVDTAGVALVDAWIMAMPTNACGPQP